MIDARLQWQRGDFALDVALELPSRGVSALFGPSGCGKSTLLRAINRMHELYPDIQTKGDILLDGQSIFSMSVIELRRKVGMVF